MDTEVAIIGAGLAGLRCAQVLSSRGVAVRIYEASDRVGGRVASDVVDGFTIDRGFQLLNTAYPALRRSVDLSGLDLRAFDRGVRLEQVNNRRLLLDPRQNLFSGPRTLRNLPGTFQQQLQLGRTLAKLAFGASPHLPEPELPTAQWFANSRFSGPLVDEVLQPFLAGVTLDPSLSGSSTVTALILRSLLRGRAAVPAQGMGALPGRMAMDLPPGTVLTQCRVAAITPTGLSTSHGDVRAAVVVLATDWPMAQELLPQLGSSEMNAVTTWWHALPESPDSKVVCLDLEPSPITNTVAMSAAAPYAPKSQGLIASSAPGTRADSATDAAVREAVARCWDVAEREVELIATSVIAHALPRMSVPLNLTPPLEVAGIVVAGDHRATASIQGALASGERSAKGILKKLGRTKKP